MKVIKRFQLGRQPSTDRRHFYFKDNEVTPEFAAQLMGLGVKIHNQRDDDWFWDTWRDRA